MSKAFVRITDVKLRKVDSKSEEYIFLGYEKKAYWLYDNI